MVFRMICADAVGKGICYGDSGGPLVFNSSLLGVASWTPGQGCGQGGNASLFASIPDQCSWLKNFTGIP